MDDALLMFDKFQGMFPEATTPADVTPEMANEFKRKRAEVHNSPWSTKGDLATLRAVFGKWLMRECGLLIANPFANVKPPKCDEPDVRIVAAEESKALFDWLSTRWNGWKLPAVYLEVAALLGWRAMEIASIRDEDLLQGGFVRVTATKSKTRKYKYGWLPADLYDRVKACSAGGWVFGRFSDELRRLLLLWMRKPHLAACVREFTPKRLVGWLQDELGRFNDEAAEAVEEGQPKPERFALHDFRRTAITWLQMAGVSEKEVSVMVGATPEVIRRHYEKLDQLAIAKRSVQRRLFVVNYVPGNQPVAHDLPRRCRTEQNQALDGTLDLPETATA